MFDFSTLLLLFAMIVVGGINSAKGILIGTALLQFIEQHFVSWGAPRLILLGVIMLAITLITHGRARRHSRDQISAGRCGAARAPSARRRRRSGAGRRGDHERRARPQPRSSTRIDALQRRARGRDRSKAVRIPSVNPKYPGQVYDEVVGGEGEVSKFVGEVYAALGAEVDLLAIEPGRENAVGVVRARAAGAR